MEQEIKHKRRAVEDETGLSKGGGWVPPAPSFLWWDSEIQ